MFNKNHYEVGPAIVRIGGGLFLFFLLTSIGFIVYKSATFFHDYGFSHFFGRNWNAKAKPNGEFGVGNLIINTSFVLLVSMAIAIPLMIFAAVFINEFMTLFWKNRVKSLVRILAGIPSVVFGLFGLSVLGSMLQKLHPGSSEGVGVTSFILTCIIIAFMGLPIMLALTIDALAAIPNRVRASAAALGISRPVYSLLILRLVWLRVVGAILLGIARIIGETMAVLMIAGNNPNGLHFHNGLTQFLYSQIATLASLIGFEVLESTNGLHTSALYAVGLLLFVLVLIINLLVLALTKFSRRWRQIRHFNLVGSKKQKTVPLQEVRQLIRKSNRRGRQLTGNKVKQGVIMGFLISSTALVLGFIGWIALTIVVRGCFLMDRTDFVTSNPNVGIQASFLVSLLLVILTMVIAVPVALLIAVMLTEYSRRGSWVAGMISYVLNVLASTPSIIYGLFGLYFFIFLLHMPLSILSGALTLSFLLLPMLVRNLQEAFLSVPNRLRAASLALGVKKTTTTHRVVLAESRPAIVTAVSLAAGRAIGESAPIYLTLGTTVVFPHAGFLSPGAAMSTQILSLWRVGGGENATRIMYELAFLIMLLVWAIGGLGAFLALLFSNRPRPSVWSSLRLFYRRRNNTAINLIAMR